MAIYNFLKKPEEQGKIQDKSGKVYDVSDKKRNVDYTVDSNNKPRFIDDIDYAKNLGSPMKKSTYNFTKTPEQNTKALKQNTKTLKRTESPIDFNLLDSMSKNVQSDTMYDFTKTPDQNKRPGFMEESPIRQSLIQRALGNDMDMINDSRTPKFEQGESSISRDILTSIRSSPEGFGDALRWIANPLTDAASSVLGIQNTSGLTREEQANLDYSSRMGYAPSTTNNKSLAENVGSFAGELAGYGAQSLVTAPLMPAKIMAGIGALKNPVTKFLAKNVAENIPLATGMAASNLQQTGDVPGTAANFGLDLGMGIAGELGLKGLGKGISRSVKGISQGVDIAKDIPGYSKLVKDQGLKKGTQQFEGLNKLARQIDESPFGESPLAKAPRAMSQVMPDQVENTGGVNITKEPEPMRLSGVDEVPAQPIRRVEADETKPIVGQGSNESDYNITTSVDKIGDTEVNVTKIETPKGDGSVEIIEGSPASPNNRLAVDRFKVEESQRGQGKGTELLKEAVRVTGNRPTGGQVSSIGSVKSFYKAGFRPYENVEVTLDEAVELFKKNESLYMVNDSNLGAKPTAQAETPIIKQPEPQVRQPEVAESQAPQPRQQAPQEYTTPPRQNMGESPIQQPKQPKQPITEKDLPTKATELRKVVKEMEEAQKKGIDIDLQLFAKAKKRLEALSEFRSNTLEKAEYLQSPEFQQAIDEADLVFEKKPNKQSIDVAVQRLEDDYFGTKKKIETNGARDAEDVVAASIIMRDLAAKAAKSGKPEDYKAVGDFAKAIQPKVTNTAQQLQAQKLWVPETVEGAIVKAQRTVDAAEKDMAETNPRKIKQAKDEADRVTKEMDKARNRAVQDVADEVADNVDEIVKSKGKKRVSKKGETETSKKTEEENEYDPAMDLAVRIEKSLNKGKPKEKDVLRRLVDELYSKYKETLPEGELKKIKKSKIVALGEAMRERRLTAEIWNKAKAIVEKDLGDDVEKLEILEDYFEKGTRPPFSDKTFNSAFNEATKELNMNLRKVIKQFYSEGIDARGDLEDYIVKKAGVRGEDAKVLAKYIDNRFKDLRKQYSEEYLAGVFKERAKPTTGSVLRKIEELSNTGAFDNTNYSDKVLGKLNPKLRQAIKESGVNMYDLVVKGIKATDLERVKFLKYISEELKVNDKDALRILEAAESEFNLVAKETQTKILKNMFRDYTKNKPKLLIDKVMELIELDAFNKPEIVEKIKARNGIPVLDGDDIKQITDIFESIKDMDKTSYDYRAGVATVERIIGDKIPVEIANKFGAYQRMNLLLAPKGRVRDLVSNLIIAFNSDVTDILATTMEMPLTLIPGYKRKNYLPNFGAKTKGMWKGLSESYKDYVRNIDTTGAMKSQYDFGRYSKTPFSESGKRFGWVGKVVGRTLNEANKLTSFLTEVADRPFFEAAKASNLINIMKAAGVKAATKEMIKEAEEVAGYQTLRNLGYFAQFFSKLQKGVNIAFAKSLKIGTAEFGVGNFILPFTKAVGNLMDMAIDYNPVLVHTMITHALDAKRGTFNQKKFFQDLSKKVTGLGIVFAGWKLAEEGIVTGKGEDDYDMENYLKEEGKRPYSFNINGKSYSYDWALPFSILLAMGADMHGAYMKEEDVQKAMWSAIQTGGQTMFEMPALQGFNKLFQSYGGRSDVMKNFMGTLVDVSQQMVPLSTLSRQLTQYMDSNERVTKDPDQFVEAKNKIMNRIPGVSQQLPIKIGSEGQEMKNFQGREGVGRFIEAFFSPTIIGDKTDAGTNSQVRDEVMRLYTDTNTKTHVPSMLEKSFTINKENYKLTAEEYTTYQKQLAEETLAGYDKVINSSEYNLLSDTDKVKALNDVQNKAKASVRKQYAEDNLIDTKVEKGAEELEGDVIRKIIRDKNSINFDTFKINDETYKLSKSEITDYKERYNRLAEETYDIVTSDETFQGLEPEDKMNFITSAMTDVKTSLKNMYAEENGIDNSKERTEEQKQLSREKGILRDRYNMEVDDIYKYNDHMQFIITEDTMYKKLQAAETAGLSKDKMLSAVRVIEVLKPQGINPRTKKPYVEPPNAQKLQAIYNMPGLSPDEKRKALVIMKLLK